MFARFIQLNIKPEKKSEFVKTLKEQIVPVLKKNTGFFDLIPLQVEIAPAKFFAISVWKSKLDAEKYEKEFYPTVKQILEPEIFDRDRFVPPRVGGKRGRTGINRARVARHVSVAVSLEPNRGGPTMPSPRHFA